MTKKVFVFGIDGAPPELIFDKWLDDLPTIKKITDNSKKYVSPYAIKSINK